MKRQPRYEAPGVLLHWGAVAGGVALALQVGDSPLWALTGWLYLLSFPFRLFL